MDNIGAFVSIFPVETNSDQIVRIQNENVNMKNIIQCEFIKVVFEDKGKKFLYFLL